MFTSSKTRILRTFSANDWNDPESNHSPFLTATWRINALQTFTSNAEKLRKSDLHITK